MKPVSRFTVNTVIIKTIKLNIFLNMSVNNKSASLQICENPSDPG